MVIPEVGTGSTSRRGVTVPAGTTVARRSAVPWIILIVAGLFEVAWAMLLDATKGFTRLWPTVGFVITLAISMYLLSVATRHIPIGTAYAVWVGIGAAGAFAVAVIFKDEPTTFAQVLAMGALVASIIAVKLTAPH
jgi:quaternary ammonium compound-resistance protein SugE